MVRVCERTDVGARRSAAGWTDRGRVGREDAVVRSIPGCGTIDVHPGDTVEFVHTFEAASTMIGCHEPGHWEAGMKMDIDV